ncbi:MAG: HK97 family phage prohead protease [Pirellulales bacterium]|nr:HK97 family phage prohead protease [Pirellulales bacterium]
MPKVNSKLSTKCWRVFAREEADMIETRLSTAPASAPAVAPTTGGNLRTITGYAAVFFNPTIPGSELKLGPSTYERIAPTAFTRALRERDDVRALFNHDSNMVLGRTKAGTLKLRADTIGLRYEITVDVSDPFVLHCVKALERGDVDGSSFAFIIEYDRWERDLTRKADIRWITGVKLLDISPVTFPAYDATSSQIARSFYDPPLPPVESFPKREAVLREMKLYEKSLRK